MSLVKVPCSAVVGLGSALNVEMRPSM
jgi:hypothetical protein